MLLHGGATACRLLKSGFDTSSNLERTVRWHDQFCPYRLARVSYLDFGRPRAQVAPGFDEPWCRAGAFAVAMVVRRLALGATVRVAYAAGLETLDPVHAVDALTQAVAGTLFDQLYTYDYLARPVRLPALAADGTLRSRLLPATQ